MLGRVAQRQHGVFTRRQALDCGFTPGEIDGRVKRKEWIAVDHGVYRSVETPPSWRQRLLAACLAGPAVASHRSAAALWGLPDFGEECTEVTALRHRRRKSDAVLWHESVRLTESDATVLDGVPTTNATRTVFDLGAVVGEETVLRALDDALRRKLTSIGRILTELDRWDPRRRGSGVVRRAVAKRLDQMIPQSVLESEFDALVRAFDLPKPSRQWPVRDADGQIVARVDFAYPAARLVIETDGLRFHAGPDDWRADVARQNKVMALGFRVLRFTADDIRLRPDQVDATIRAALRSRDASLDPPGDGERRNK